MDPKFVAAGAFKQGCLALLDEVEEKHVEIIVTKRGRPVARLVPIREARDVEADVLADLRSRGARMLVDVESFIAPTEADAGWSQE